MSTPPYTLLILNTCISAIPISSFPCVRLAGRARQSGASCRSALGRSEWLPYLKFCTETALLRSFTLLTWRSTRCIAPASHFQRTSGTHALITLPAAAMAISPRRALAELFFSKVGFVVAAGRRTASRLESSLAASTWQWKTRRSMARFMPVSRVHARGRRKGSVRHGLRDTALFSRNGGGLAQISSTGGFVGLHAQDHRCKVPVRTRASSRSHTSLNGLYV